MIALLALLLLLGVPSIDAAPPPAVPALGKPAAPVSPVLRLAPLAAPVLAPDGGPGEEARSRSRPIPAWYQDSATPGGIVRVTTLGRAQGLAVRLLDARGRTVSRSTGYRDGKRWVALLGIPSTAAAGSWRLAIGVSDGTVTRWSAAPVSVTARTFASEEIALTRTLSALRAEPDPRKAQEARELAEVLSTFDPSAAWETGSFTPPVTGSRRSAGYGDRRLYRYDDGSTDLSVHAGIDLALPEGSPVIACGRGRVVFAGWRIITGGTVVLEHLPGVHSVYYHLSAVLVASGELLERGERLGSVGMTGLATGPHLHWEVQASGVALDPDLLTASPLALGPGAPP